MKNARCSRCIQNDGVLCFVLNFGLEENLNFNKLVPNFEGYGQESAVKIKLLKCRKFPSCLTQRTNVGALTFRRREMNMRQKVPNLHKKVSRFTLNRNSVARCRNKK